MVALLILKYVRNLSDESVVDQWAKNSYYQYFSGEHSFVPGIPCVPAELVAFRHRIGEEGMELILKESIKVNEPSEPGGGSKASVLVDQGTGIIAGAYHFTQTLDDYKTVPDALEQYERLTGTQAAEVLVDRGYRGTRTNKETQMRVPQPQNNITKSKRKKHSRRAAIEPINQCHT